MPKIIKTKKLTTKSYNTPTLYVFSAIKGLTVFLIGLVLCSVMVLKSTQSNFFFYLIYLFIALGAFWCGFDASRKIDGRGFVKGIISSSAYMLVIILLSVVLMRFNISANILLLVPICLIPGFAGGISAVK